MPLIPVSWAVTWAVFWPLALTVIVPALTTDPSSTGSYVVDALAAR